MAISKIILKVAGLVASWGALKAFDAYEKNQEAKEVNASANKLVEDARAFTNQKRIDSSKSLQLLGEVKLSVLDESIYRFVNTFEKIKNIELSNTVGIEELNKFRIDKNATIELRELSVMAHSVMQGLVAGSGAGALTAYGAYSATMMLAKASTGTAIATLSGVAAKNATLAFLGGGALAAGGGGMAMGSIVLGGVIAAPAIAILGVFLDATASKNLDLAYVNQAEAMVIIEELKIANDIFEGIKNRSELFIDLLYKLNPIFVKLINQIERLVVESGTNFSEYSQSEKEKIAMSLSIAGAIKSVLDTPILTEDGNITVESEKIGHEIGKRILNQ